MLPNEESMNLIKRISICGTCTVPDTVHYHYLIESPQSIPHRKQCAYFIDRGGEGEHMAQKG